MTKSLKDSYEASIGLQAKLDAMEQKTLITKRREIIS